ncbi:ATP-binding protein [Halalkalicoccus jeotgali]|uniref:histidine kinase n=1 Tax=Halalkalicoccus jeotgali (strain DSM 18796 / CECT 7217 / JCM 14584 / KCTC 4019 / B3) TaxID=795797 RepID=D8J6D8_HALJB|nr:ATP-binding protein [Halalkalicoccus jeotgali]ADJ15856.1 integral membrane sensor signal transduction histidine kinase [Halalkalicoccus jeotgali B3]ELY37952.1 integral membrane sensor signal transduction histidine kinase [Halalkalicoccus jeotgali B3]
MSSSLPIEGGNGVIVFVGGVYVLLAIGLTYVQVASNVSFRATPMEIVLLAGPGVVLVYGGYRLTEADVHPDFYPTITRWCLGGCGLMIGLLVLYHVQPGTSVSTSNPIGAVLVALSSVAGYEAGLHNARAKELSRTRDRLDTTVERLRTSNERLERFAYAASHDLQEPLRMVSSYLRLLERRCGSDLNEEGRECLEIAVDGSDRMIAMVDGLLRYSRVTTGDDSFEPVELADTLADARADLRVLIHERGAEITAGTLPVVMGTPGQLEQVFQNLLSNAIHYAGEGPARVHVSAARTGGWWTVTVSDDGTGIEPEYADAIFELFERATTDEEHAGSGIGLALCERIVERHGGEIWVESAPGEGAAFSFTLPAVDGGEENA